MPSTEDPYVRVYQRILTDPKFESIYEDDHHLATWLRLLLVADQMWPVSAPVPRSTRETSLRALVKAGLVDLMPKHCYRIHGLDAERNARSIAGRNAAAVRWQSVSNAGALPEQYRPNASPSTSPRPSPSTEESTPDGYDEVVRYLASRKAWLDSPKVQVELARMVDRRGTKAVLEEMAKDTTSETAAQFVYGARNRLFPLQGSVTAKSNGDEERERFDRGVAATQRMLAKQRGEA